MTTFTILWTWIAAHPIECIAIAAYIVANVAPRPHPEALTGWRRTFWLIVDRLCLLTAGRLPGALKWLLSASPSPPPPPDPPRTEDSGSGTMVKP